MLIWYVLFMYQSIVRVKALVWLSGLVPLRKESKDSHWPALGLVPLNAVASFASSEVRE